MKVTAQPVRRTAAFVYFCHRCRREFSTLTRGGPKSCGKCKNKGWRYPVGALPRKRRKEFLTNSMGKD